MENAFEARDQKRFAHDGVKLVAHRGASGVERENSAAAFIAAGNRSYWGIETDVHVTADGYYVILHDERTGRVADIDIDIEKSTLDEIKKVHLLDFDGRAREDLVLPMLSDYVRICKAYGKYAVLELKNRFTKAQIGEIIDIVGAEGMLPYTIFISFEFDNLIDLKAIDPSLTAQFLTGEWSDDLPNVLAQAGLGLDAYYEILNAERIAALHAKGCTVNCWTVDKVEDAIALCEAGVDQITSNKLE